MKAYSNNFYERVNKLKNIIPYYGSNGEQDLPVKPNCFDIMDKFLSLMEFSEPALYPTENGDLMLVWDESNIQCEIICDKTESIEVFKGDTGMCSVFSVDDDSIWHAAYYAWECLKPSPIKID